MKLPSTKCAVAISQCPTITTSIEAYRRKSTYRFLSGGVCAASLLASDQIRICVLQVRFSPDYS